MKISTLSFLLLASNVNSAPRRGHPKPGIRELANKNEMSSKVFNGMFKASIAIDKSSAISSRDERYCTAWMINHGICPHSNDNDLTSDSDLEDTKGNDDDKHWWTGLMDESNDSCSDISDDEKPMPRCKEKVDGWTTDPDEKLAARDVDDDDGDDGDSYKLMLMEERDDSTPPRSWVINEDNLHLGNCHTIHWDSMGFPKGGTPYIKFIAFQAEKGDQVVPATPAIQLFSSADCTGDFYAVSDDSMILLERSDQLRSWVVPTV